MDWELELIAIPVSDVDRAKAFYTGLQLTVSDIEAARAELVERGVEASDVQSFPWGSCVFFADPDGNRWSVQEIPTRD
jgi:predicted enzyme related to lactoylglutathione lyase